MKAAVMDGIRQPLVVRDVEEPQLAPGGAIVRVEANGICRSDWHLWVGDWTWFGAKLRFPHVLGHEFCGVVEEVGAGVGRFKKGDRVLVPFSQGEGTCGFCRSGKPHLCDRRITPGAQYWGGYGRYVAVPFADMNLVPLPDSIGFIEAASMGCRFMTSFHALVDRARVSAGEWVAVHGCGGIGLSAIHIATALGANVIGVDISDDKVEMAKKVGAVAAFNAKSTDAVRAIVDLTRGGADVAVDALGVTATCRASIACVRKQGRHLQIGLTGAAEKGEIPVPIDLVVLKELSLIGSFGMPAPRFGTMLGMVEAGKLAPGHLVSRTVALEEAGDVLASMADFGTLGVTVIDRY
jgi:D-arabinose 1-dehydrogenase-like Zn-dependent alcohol dehydrogenase